MRTGLAGIAENDKNKFILGLSRGKDSLKGGIAFPVTPEAPQPPGRRRMNALQTPQSSHPAPCSPHPTSLEKGCPGLGPLVFLASPLPVQCPRVKITGLEGTALTLLLSAQRHPTPTPGPAPPGLGAMAFCCFSLAPSHLLRSQQPGRNLLVWYILAPWSSWRPSVPFHG